LLTAALLGLSLALAGCGEAPKTADPAVTAQEALAAGSEVVARVNGKPIFKADVLAEAVLKRWITVAEDLDPASPQFTKIVEELIERKLFAEEAETQKLDQDADVQRRLERAREIVLHQALQAKVSSEELSEESVARFYREQVRQIPLGQKVRARIIVTATREDAEAAKRLLDRGQSFAAVAFERSQDPQTRAEGGDLGEFLPERLADGLRQAAETAPVGQVAGPIQTSRGWHLIKIESRRQEEAPTLEQLRPEMQRWLVFNAMNELYARLSSSARIEKLVEDAGVALPAEQGDTTEEPSSVDDTPLAPQTDAPMGPGALAGAAGRELVRPAPGAAKAPPRPETAPSAGAAAPAGVGPPIVITPKTQAATTAAPAAQAPAPQAPVPTAAQPPANGQPKTPPAIPPAPKKVSSGADPAPIALPQEPRQ
jgi:peptidyl-prolyl cis-trans isomerase C